MTLPKLVLLFSFNLLHLSAYAQLRTDSIHEEHIAGNRNYFYKGETISYKKLTELLQAKKSSEVECGIANDYKVVAKVVGFAAGFLVGYPIGTVLSGKTPNWNLLKAGIGLMVVSIPFNRAANKHLSKSILLYNSSE